MDQVVIAAKNRADTGSGNAGRLRRAGQIPAVMYGSSGKVYNLALDSLEFIKSTKGISESTIVKINLDGQAHEAFVKDSQRSILDGKILHVDFYEVQKDTLLRAKVPVHVIGTAVGTREGGILEAPLHELEVECLPRDLPEKIEVDVSALKANQSIHVRDLQLPAGVKVISNSDQVVALVKYAKAEVVEAETAAAAEAAAAPAAAAPAAAPAAKS